MRHQEAADKPNTFLRPELTGEWVAGLSKVYSFRACVFYVFGTFNILDGYD